MSQKLSVGSFKWVECTSKFSKHFIENYNVHIDERYFFEGDVEYSEKLYDLHNDLPFLPERMKIE